MTKFTFAQREEGFDNHIEHSIRGYTNLWNDVLKYSEYFVEDHTNVVDIGCSTGTSRFLEMIAALSESEKNSIFIFD